MEEKPRNQQSSMMQDNNSRLSKVSMMHDKGNKGYLDPVEKELRNRDTNDQGALTDEQIRQVAQDYLDSQKKGKTMRNGALVLAFMLVLSTIANIGTAFLAVSLNKDTKPDSSGVLKTTSGDNVVATRSVGVSVSLNVQTNPETNGTYACITPEQATSIWLDVQEGNKVMISTKTSDREQITELEVSGSYITDKRVAFPVHNQPNGTVRILFESSLCSPPGSNGDTSPSGGGGRRLLYSAANRRPALALCCCRQCDPDCGPLFDVL